MYLLAKNRGIVSKLLYLIKDTNPQGNTRSDLFPLNFYPILLRHYPSPFAYRERFIQTQ